eukprot:m51a1_g2172 hypothetical protein (488) ;mRNA; f:69375-71244
MVHVQIIAFARLCATHVLAPLAYCFCSMAVGFFLSPKKIKKAWNDARELRTLVGLHLWVWVALPAIAYGLARAIKLSGAATFGLLLCSVSPVSTEAALFALFTQRAHFEMCLVAAATTGVASLGTIALASFWGQSVFPSSEPALRIPAGDCLFMLLYSVVPAVITAAFAGLLRKKGQNSVAKWCGVTVSVIAVILWAILILVIWIDMVDSKKWNDSWGASISYTLIAPAGAYIIGYITRSTSPQRLGSAFCAAKQAGGLTSIVMLCLSNPKNGGMQVGAFEVMSTGVCLGMLIGVKILQRMMRVRKVRRIWDIARARWADEETRANAAIIIQRRWRKYRAQQRWKKFLGPPQAENQPPKKRAKGQPRAPPPTPDVTGAQDPAQPGQQARAESASSLPKAQMSSNVARPTTPVTVVRPAETTAEHEKKDEEEDDEEYSDSEYTDSETETEPGTEDEAGSKNKAEQSTTVKVSSVEDVNDLEKGQKPNA